MIKVTLKTRENIDVKLKPRQGIKIDSSNKYLFDPSLMQEYVDLTKDYSDKAMQSEANAKASEMNAELSAEEAKQSELNAKQSEVNAKNSETIAKASEQKAIQEANASAESAYQSQQSALASYQYSSNAEADAQNVNETLGLVLESESNVTQIEQRVKQSETNAKISEQNAEKAVEDCEYIKNSLGSVYVFKGSVKTVSDLPTNAKVGDVYDVQDSGINYAWTGEEWDALGVNVDLSNYALKSDLNSKQDKLTAGTGISINNNVISNTQTSAEWGNIKGTLSNQTDLQNALNGKANLNLGNSTAITNCITEIPQDIKLELKDGTLTVKAGTKFYLPDGKQYQISADTTVPAGGADVPYFILGKVTGGTYESLTRIQISSCYSGSTQPSFSGSGIWFDTANNVIKFSTDNGSTWLASDFSLPLAICTPQSSTWVSIDQVFNGFGYIGSTVFALPGVKGLIPNGRNEDGTLRNREFTTNGVLTFTTGSHGFIGIRENAIGISGSYSFDEVNNQNLNGDSYWNVSVIAKLGYSSGKITSFNPKQPFRAVDYNDLPQVAGRNVGDIFYTSRTDTELNGAVECNGGTYSTSDFTGSQSIGNLLSAKKVPYVSLSEYASIVSTNGSCRAFGWDGGTSFRVPLLKDVYIEAGTAESSGEFISESLPNIKATWGEQGAGYWNNNLHEATGAVTVSQGKWTGATSHSVGNQNAIWNFNASRSSSAYKDGAKVKPDSIRYRAMVQLAIKSTDQAVITATSALQQIANKVDRNEADYVVESYDDGTIWYKIYKNGWMVQGGNTQTSSAANNSVITFKKPFKDTNYIVLALGNASESIGTVFHDKDEKKTTGFTIRCSTAAYGFNWEAKGYYR